MSSLSTYLYIRSHGHSLLGSPMAFHKLDSSCNDDIRRFSLRSTEAISVYIISVPSVISPPRSSPIVGSYVNSLFSSLLTDSV